MMLDHIVKYGEAPKFFRFDQRHKYDIDAVADHIFEQEMGDKGKMLHLKGLWDEDETGWRILFGEDFRHFAKTVLDAVNRLNLDLQEPVSGPKTILGKKSAEDCSMAELYDKHRKHWREIHDAVYAAAYDKKSKKYRCAATGWKSTRRSEFQIDHIMPRSAGGKTVLENLRLLRRRENAKKGANWEE